MLSSLHPSEMVLSKTFNQRKLASCSEDGISDNFPKEIREVSNEVRAAVFRSVLRLSTSHIVPHQYRCSQAGWHSH